MDPMVPESMMVFTGNANPKLAQAVTKYLNIPLGSATVNRFSDGEVMVQLLDNVRGKDVFILQSTCAPTNDNLMELIVKNVVIPAMISVRNAIVCGSNPSNFFSISNLINRMTT